MERPSFRGVVTKASLRKQCTQDGETPISWGGYKRRSLLAGLRRDGETIWVGSLGLFKTPFAGRPSAKEGPRCFRATFLPRRFPALIPSRRRSAAARRPVHIRHLPSRPIRTR